MTRAPRKTFADKQAMLARGEPWVVHPREVAKCTHAYHTDSEIILGCIIVSGTLDTSDVLNCEIYVTNGIDLSTAIALSTEQRAAYAAFRSVWQNPTEEQRAAVMGWARRIDPKKGRVFRWARPT